MQAEQPRENADAFYWAFLSYSSKDTALSRRLYQRLENYSIPRDLVGRPGRDGAVPRRLFPCFRDRDELPLSANLGGTIEDALRASRYLIVICSPDSARSRWVNEEIRYFKSLGRSDRILAIIAAGEPNASDQPSKQEAECFAPALRYAVGPDGRLTSERVEPIAGDLRPGGDGWTNSFLKAVAGITGLGYNAFAQREARRRRRRQMWAGAAALLLLAAAAWGWDYFRVKSFYYWVAASRWSVPEGGSEMSSGNVRNVAVSYRVEFSRRKVRRVTRLNGSGRPVNDSNRHGAATQEISYRENGELEAIRYLSRSGREVFRETYGDMRNSEAGNKRHFVDFKLHDQDAPASLPKNFSLLGLSSSDKQSDSTKSDITGEILDYSADGRIARIQYVNAYRIPRPNGDGIFGQRFEYNPMGLAEKIENLGADNQPLPDKLGVVLVRRTFDAFGNIIKNAYSGINGQPVLSKEGYASFVSKTDDRGNIIETAYFGVGGQPIIKKGGFARLSSKYDERSNLIEQAYFGVDGRPMLQGDGVARLVQRFDERGNQIEASYFDVDGQPVLNKDGHAKWTGRFNERGDQIEGAYFGVDGQPAFLKGGHTKWTAGFDARGDEIEGALFGVNGQRVLIKDGYASWTSKYDERGNKIEQSYFGLNGQLAVHKNGYARWTNKLMSEAISSSKLTSEPMASRPSIKMAWPDSLRNVMSAAT